MSVTTKCYGEVKTWKSKAEAIKYFTEAMFGCDPGTSECARYTTILSKLRSGETMATDDEDDYENDDFESLVAQFEKKETKKKLEKVQDQLAQEEQEEQTQNIEELKAKLKGLMTSTNVKNKVKEYMKSKNIKTVKDLSIEQLEELIGLLS